MDILSRDAQYDLSCACGTKRPDEHRKRSLGGDSWLYPVTVTSGGTGIMLKTLLGNVCSNDCLYCPLRCQRDFKRVIMTPDELATFYMDFLRKRRLIGIFLSSGVMGSAERTMHDLVATAEILRKKYRYRGYIHLKIIPGASRPAIDAAMKYASAVSLNIETPGAQHFRRLTHKKDYHQDILEPLQYILSQTSREGTHPHVTTSSQFIVGASDETDKDILTYCNTLYGEMGMNRLYYSAYQRGLGDPSIPGEMVGEDVSDASFKGREQYEHYRQTRGGEFTQNWSSNATLFPELASLPARDDSLLVREHRLYQADWLMRIYKFSFADIQFSPDGNLDLTRDPKQIWADTHPEFYPVSVRKAPEQSLLRIPGIGPVYAKKIVMHRRNEGIYSLNSLPVPPTVLSKALPYIIL